MVGAVYQEVQDHNVRKQSAVPYRGLIQPEGYGQSPSGSRSPTKPRPIDWNRQFEKALEAFEANQVLILIEDRQAESLDQTFTIGPRTTVTFLASRCWLEDEHGATRRLERRGGGGARPADRRPARENPWESPGKYFGVELAQTIAGPKLLALNKRQQAAALGRFLDHRARYVELARTRSHQAQHSDPHSQDVASSRALADVAIWGLLKRTLPLSDETLTTALGLILSVSHLNAFLLPLAGIAAAVENRAADGPFGAELEQDLRSAIKRLREEALDAGSRKAADRMTKLVVEEPTAWIDSGEAWSDAAIADLDATDPVGARTGHTCSHRARLPALVSRRPNG